MTKPGIFELEYSLPEWLRPTFRGALFILGMGSGWTGGVFALSILVTFMLMAGATSGLVVFLKLLGVALVAGALAGTIQGALHGMDHWGRIGTWLRWFLSIFGYVVAFGNLTPNWPFSLKDPALYAIATGIAMLGAGCVMLTDERRPSRLSPREFRLTQNRELMWLSADRVHDRMRSLSADAGLHDSADSILRVSARERVRQDWTGSVRRSGLRLSWWTRK